MEVFLPNIYGHYWHTWVTVRFLSGPYPVWTGHVVISDQFVTCVAPVLGFVTVLDAVVSHHAVTQFLWALHFARRCGKNTHKMSPLNCYSNSLCGLMHQCTLLSHPNRILWRMKHCAIKLPLHSKNCLCLCIEREVLSVSRLTWFTDRNPWPSPVETSGLSLRTQLVATVTGNHNLAAMLDVQTRFVGADRAVSDFRNFTLAWKEIIFCVLESSLHMVYFQELHQNIHVWTIFLEWLLSIWID